MRRRVTQVSRYMYALSEVGRSNQLREPLLTWRRVELVYSSLCVIQAVQSSAGLDGMRNMVSQPVDAKTRKVLRSICPPNDLMRHLCDRCPRVHAGATFALARPHSIRANCSFRVLISHLAAEQSDVSCQLLHAAADAVCGRASRSNLHDTLDDAPRCWRLQVMTC